MPSLLDSLPDELLYEIYGLPEDEPPEGNPADTDADVYGDAVVPAAPAAPAPDDLARFVRQTDKKAVPFYARVVKCKPYRDAQGNVHDECCYMTKLEDTAPHLDSTGTYGQHFGQRG